MFIIGCDYHPGFQQCQRGQLGQRWQVLRHTGVTACLTWDADYLYGERYCRRMLRETDLLVMPSQSRQCTDFC